MKRKQQKPNNDFVAQLIEELLDLYKKIFSRNVINKSELGKIKKKLMFCRKKTLNLKFCFQKSQLKSMG